MEYHEQQHATFGSTPLRVLDSDFHDDIYGCNDSEFAIRRGLVTPFFFKPNIVIHPGILAEKSPLKMKYGENIVAGHNWIDCRVRVENRPPRGYKGFFQRKGRASARNVQASLWTQIVGQRNVRVRPLEWIGLSENLLALPVLPNDGVPVVLHILRIRLNDHAVMVARESSDGETRYLPPALYELSVQVDKTICYLGRYRLPEDLVALAKEPDDVVYAAQSGGFAVYVEKTEDGVIANFEGTIEDTGPIRDIAKEYKPSKILINGQPLDASVQSLLE